MFYKNRHLKIKGTGSYVPDKIVTNEELELSADTSASWISETLGIRERRVVAGNTFTSDLASQAGLNAIENAGIDKNDVELIIVATSTPDRKAPSTACITQHKMGITNNCAAFDIAAVCSGFLYAMTMGAQFIQTGMYKNILIIGADIFSSITDWDRRDCVFFGDGAGAAVLSYSEEENLFSSLLFADGRGQDHFTVYPDDAFYSMNGKAVFDTATKVLPACISEVLERNNIFISDISMVLPHQPSIGILKKTAEVLDIPFEKVKTNMDRYANTSGATIPLLLDEQNRGGNIKPGDTVVFAAVGSGWTWGAAVYTWR